MAAVVGGGGRSGGACCCRCDDDDDDHDDSDESENCDICRCEYDALLKTVCAAGMTRASFTGLYATDETNRTSCAALPVSGLIFSTLLA